MAGDPRLFFIDANVLAKPITRTLLIVGADPSDLAYTWSQRSEEEANRHLGPRATSVTEVRTKILQRSLGPDGIDASRFEKTTSTDRQILADASAAGAGYLITADVDDFADDDIFQVSIFVVNPDLFMAIRFPRSAYVHAIEQLVANMQNLPAMPSRCTPS